MGQALIEHVPSERLSVLWPWLKVGVDAIIRKAQPDWTQHDLFYSILQKNSLLFTTSRNQRALGWFSLYVTQNAWTKRNQLFLWCAWNLPLRDRLPDDDVPGANADSLAFIKAHARAMNCEKILTLSRRRGYERYGWRRTFFTYELNPLD